MSMLQQMKVKKTSMEKVMEKLKKEDEISLKVMRLFMDKGDTELEWYYNELNLYFQYMYQREAVGNLYLKTALEQMDALDKQEKKLDRSKDEMRKDSIKKKMEEQVKLVIHLEYMIRESKKETDDMWKIYAEKVKKSGKSKAVQLQEMKSYYAEKEMEILDLRVKILELKD